MEEQGRDGRRWQEAAAEPSVPLLEKKAGCVLYVEGCPGCAVDRRKAVNPGIPYGNFIYVWTVTLCTEDATFSFSFAWLQDALKPYMSRKAVELHWGKHQQDYVDGLNKQLAISPLYGHTLEDLIKEAYNNSNPLPESNDVAEVWNHHFF